MLEPELITSQFVNGFQVPAFYSKENVLSALEYKPRPDDIFIATYPKCGTTWAQHILMLLFRHGQPPDSNMEFFKTAVYIDSQGAKSAENMLKPGAIKTHFPFHMIPWSKQAKYICITRNPKDCCVSYYHHMKGMPGHSFKGTFDQFFELFLAGMIDFGDYFDNLMGWYEHRNDPNVLFLTYEEMKENTEAAILKMASFIDDEIYAEPLRKDPEMLNNVVKYSSIQCMREGVNKGMEELLNMSKEDVLKSDVSEDMKKFLCHVQELEDSHKPTSVNFVRKGIVGDWRNYFSEDQSKRMDQKFAERTKGTDIPNFWKDYM
ncbi:sulfotransferase 1 family member D1 [Nephila pilipes]|uniref:Sulfotransferase 1 family member D1 n=1 Tax=Nephila pilipes TaxID=299642 RepID=A0A8X6QA30_NEPPI|nr:sulfotransferase 1 family member D1 [Nephila pilipes]